ncbi:MAG: hypothetical protein K2I21_16235 [Acetatifactor sp.]|nr:hypothetical protein [Acetatifactor sp.]
MKAKKVLALCIAAVMTMSLAACGNDENAGGSDVQASGGEQSSESVVESTPEVTPDSSEPAGNDPAPAGPASSEFEDGLFGFAGDNTAVTGGLGNAASYNVVDYNGSKALEVVPNGKGVGIGFQIDALLGDKVSSVKTVELSIGTKSSDGAFYASSGKLYGTYGSDKNNSTWSVYLETANPKTVTYTVPDGMSFGEGDNFVVTLETDNASASVGYQTVYIDNVTFKDASGNLIEADTSAEFVAVESGLDPNLFVLKDVVELEGFACSGGAWAQAGIDLTEEQKALFVPGSIIEIEYKSDAPVWFVAISGDDESGNSLNPLGGWLRGVNQEGDTAFMVDGYVAADGSKVQYTYEQLVPYFGEDYGQFLNTLQCESSADWEVFSVKIGTDSGVVALGNAVELDGFACKGGAWAQAGIDLTEEQKALFVPGSIIEIEYSSDAPVWFVAISGDDESGNSLNPLGGWLRGVNQEGDSAFVVDGAVADGKVQYTYEQLVPYFGEDYGQFLNTLQCESSADWEVYSVKVGTAAYKPTHNVVELEGFACKAGGWAQAGIDLTEAQKALFVPGSVINIEYASDAPVWLVAISGDDESGNSLNPLGGWLRGVNQEGDNAFVVDGVVVDGRVQYTYEQLIPYFGEDYGQFLNTLQCESSADWEVYSVSVGKID